jgi:hypothetical protein
MDARTVAAQQAVQKKFGFVGGYLEFQPTTLKVSHVSASLLDIVPRWEYCIAGSYAANEENDTFLLLDETGTLVAEVKQGVYNESQNDTGRPIREEGQSVGACLLRLSEHDRKRVHFVLRRTMTNLDTEDTFEYRVILHLPPKGWTLIDWCRRRFAQAMGELERTLAMIDAEADLVQQ